MDREQFIAALRTALMQLDDLQSLRTSPLLDLIAGLDQPSQPATPSLLQRLLLDAIDALQSDPEVPLALAHDILYYRYVEQMGQSEVAYQIGVSIRQLRRYQNNAIEYLADRLWQRYSMAGQDPAQETPDVPSRDLAVGDAAFDDEIAWMRKNFHRQVSSIETELRKALEEVSVLTRHFAVKVQLDVSPPVLAMAIPPTVLRQTLMTVLTTVITRAAESTLSFQISASASCQQIESVLTQAAPQSVALGSTALDEEFWEAVHTTAQLLQPFNGQIQVDSTEPLRIRLTMPAVTGVPIIVVDDNDDVRYLYRRYAARSRFHIIDTGDSKELLPLMQQFQAAAIVIDIMMPETDGWELLAQLRRHPLTAETPVLICTILPQKNLSQYLGATAFIQKPVSQQTFLSALDHLLAFPPQVPSP